MITGVLLAAGGARRFGSQKLAADLNGVAVVRHAVDRLAQVVDELVVVVGSDGARVRDGLCGSAARVIDNALWAEGLASSLRCGIGAVGPATEAVLVALGDEPGIDPAVGRAVVAQWRASGRAIVVPSYSDRRGHPVLFAREVFAELLALGGDRGGGSLIGRDPSRVAFVDVGVLAPVDVDTVEDLRWLTRASTRRP